MRLILLILVLFSTTLFAQSPSDNVETIPTPPTLQVSGEGLKEMVLEKLDINTKINQGFSQTSMTMTFRNPNKRELAGDLVFPLPEGALVSGYALDINDVMVEGSVVKKEKARRTLETEIRKGVDPGLIEFTKGNNYRTRVFPIPAKGVRTIRVSYVNNLFFNDNARLYHLPLGFKDKIKQFNLRINVTNPKATPELLNNTLANFSFKQSQHDFIAETEQKDTRLSKPITIKIPHTTDDNVSIEQGIDGQYYFSIMHKVTNKKARPKTRGINQLSIIWDASGSRKHADHDRELSILKSYINKLTSNKKKLTVNLSVLRNTLSSPQTFNITNNDSTALIDHIKRINYDGGTQLSALNDDLSPLNNADLNIIFTDGLSNFGQHYNDKLTIPSAIISADSKTDHNLLHYIAQSTGGSYFNLNKASNEDVVNAIGNSRYAYHSSSTNTGNISDVLPASSESVGDYLVFTGKLHSNKAKLTLNFSNGSKSPDSATYILDRDTATNGNLLRTVWAQSKVNNLLIHDKDNAQAFIELGKTYNLVTPETSLLVLETFEQYVEHEVMPPNSLPQLQNRYDEHIAEKNKEKLNHEEDKIEYLIKAWEERVDWWNTDFPKPEENKKTNSEHEGETEEISVTGHRATAQRERIEIHIEDGLTAEEIGDIPALSIGEALETISGISSHEGHDHESQLDDSITQNASIELKAWSPDKAYINKLKSTGAADQVSTYYQLRKKHSTSLSFFLDCAEFFYQQENKQFALQVLSNITELELDNPALNRVVAHRLRQAGEYDLSKLMFEEVIRLRPEEPQSYRDLAFVLAEQELYKPAIEMLHSILLKDWDRFSGIELVILNELNHVIHQAKLNGITTFEIDPRLIKLLDLGVRIVMTWDADLTDIDLHVEEPTTETANYSNNLTHIGGLVSQDFTQGYGPEEYLLKKPQKGTYKIKAKYYSNNSPSVLGPVTVQLDIYTNYGRENETHQTTTIQLKDNKEIYNVGEITF